MSMLRGSFLNRKIVRKINMYGCENILPIILYRLLLCQNDEGENAERVKCRMEQRDYVLQFQVKHEMRPILVE